MKKYQHTGNVAILIRRRRHWGNNSAEDFRSGKKEILLGLKWPKRKGDGTRKRKRVGIGRWIPPGGGTEATDKSQKHSVQREVRQETGIAVPLAGFKKVGILHSRVVTTGRSLWTVHIYMVRVAVDCVAVPNRAEFQDMRWFGIHRLPRNMLPTDKKWLTRIFSGQKVSVEVLFADETLQRILPSRIRTVWGFGGGARRLG